MNQDVHPPKPSPPGMTAPYLAGWRIWTLILLLLSGSGCTRILHRATVDISPVNLDGSIAEDSMMTVLLKPYRDRLVREMQEQVGLVGPGLEKAQPESPLGNLLADLWLETARRMDTLPVDFALMNYHGIRLPALAEGPLTRGMCFELLPFDNFLAIAEMDAAGVRQLMASIAHLEGWPVSSEVRMVIGLEGVTDLTIGGLPLQTDQQYRVAMPDYVAQGGDRLSFMKGYPHSIYPHSLRDVFMDHAYRLFMDGQMLESKVEGRITRNP